MLDELDVVVGPVVVGLVEVDGATLVDVLVEVDAVVVVGVDEDVVLVDDVPGRLVELVLVVVEVDSTVVEVVVDVGASVVEVVVVNVGGGGGAVVVVEGGEVVVVVVAGSVVVVDGAVVVVPPPGGGQSETSGSGWPTSSAITKDRPCASANSLPTCTGEMGMAFSDTLIGF